MCCTGEGEGTNDGNYLNMEMTAGCKDEHWSNISSRFYTEQQPANVAVVYVARSPDLDRLGVCFGPPT